MIEKINKFEKIIEKKGNTGAGKTLDMSNGMRWKRTYTNRGGGEGKTSGAKHSDSRHVTELKMFVESLQRWQAHEHK